MKSHWRFLSGMSMEYAQECRTTQFVVNQYDLLWKLESYDLILLTTPMSFYSKEFLLGEPKINCSLRLDINRHQSIYDTSPNWSNLTISFPAGKYGIGGRMEKLLIQVFIVKSSCGNKFSSLRKVVNLKLNTVQTAEFELPSKAITRISEKDCLMNYVEHNMLTLVCNIKDIRESHTLEKPIDVSNSKLKKDTYIFTSLYQNNELFDVTLITGKERIRAHAAVLAATCPYFRKMFNSGMKEQSERTVDFSKDSEITPKILRGLLDYIYGVKSVEELKNIASDLLTLALKFDIEELKKPCEFFVSDGINNTNVASTLLFAHKYNLNILKNKALGISKMHINDIKASKEFIEIYQHVDLVKE